MECLINVNCRKAFLLGESFDTSDVTDMERMFAFCKLPGGFSLGERFDTHNVTDMGSMFWECELPKDFSLGSISIFVKSLR